MTQLQEDAKLKRGVYEEYAAQMERSAQRAGLQLPDVTLASPASPPIQPSAPHKAFILLAAAVLGLIAGLALGIARSLAGGTRVVSVRRSTTVAG
jgi:uncharacterized protein involved in exopolysaccharide biosynthesis